MPAAWPIEEVWLRPLATLGLAALLPFVTARILAALTLPPVLPPEPDAQARALAPFRAGAFVVGLVQIQVMWTVGVTALGPALVGSPVGLASHLFGALAAGVTYALGGLARGIEGRGAPLDVRTPRARPLAAIALRLRTLPWLLGPLLVASACGALLPLVAEGRVQWPLVALSLVLTFLGVAYAGPLLSVLTTALRPATPAIRAMARRAAQREGIRLFAALRLPTHGVRFANAAALPWARTMVVTDHIVELLSETELDAVLAHEAGHLSEPPWVALLRLGAVTALLFATTTGERVAAVIAPEAASYVGLATLALAVPMAFAVLALARKMEERADAHARDAVSADALADALMALAVDSRAPLVSGRRGARMHPDLYDRICACGRDLGPRPAPPARRPGLIAGLIIGAGLVAITAAADVATTIEPGSEVYAGTSTAVWRLRVDPWDPQAMLALAWASARDGDPSIASARGDEARRLGARESDVMELEAELLAAADHCDAARARFDAAIEVRARERFERGDWEPLELGGYHLPPTLVSRCGMGE